MRLGWPVSWATPSGRPEIGGSGSPMPINFLGGDAARGAVEAARGTLGALGNLESLPEWDRSEIADSTVPSPMGVRVEFKPPDWFPNASLDATSLARAGFDRGTLAGATSFCFEPKRGGGWGSSPDATRCG